MPDTESATTGQKPRSNAWQSAVTMVQDAQPPSRGLITSLPQTSADIRRQER
jgi:hypothetical protein